MDSMYEQLRSLPLFQGVGSERISELVERYPFHFLKFKPGETVISVGEKCKHVRFVVSGSVEVTTESRTLHVSLKQTLNAPEVLGPDSLFGVDNTYPFTAVAGEKCGILQLTKSDYVKVLQTDKVFLFNILNYLSSSNRRHTTSLQLMRSGSIAERLAREIMELTMQRSTDVRLQYRQKDLCTLLGTQRNSLVTALDAMAQDGLIEYTSSEIKIPSVRALQTVFQD